MKNVRFCSRFHCDHMGDRYCCATCFWRETCPNPCLNHPSRCGLEDAARRREAEARKTPSVGCADSSLKEGAKEEI